MFKTIIGWFRKNPSSIRPSVQQSTQPQPSQPTSVPVRAALDRTTGTAASWLMSEVVWLKAQTEQKRHEHESDTPEVNEKIFLVVTAFVFGALFLLEIANFIFMPASVQLFGFPINLQWLVHISIIAYLLCGFAAVETDQVAGLDFFGKPVFQFSNGLKWFPYLVFNFIKESAFLVQAEFPGDANHVHWDGEKTTLPLGSVRPIYLLTGENPTGVLPSDKQINLGVAFNVKIQATAERFFDLTKNTPPIDMANGAEILGTIVGNSNVTPRLLEIIRHLRDTGARIAAEIIGKLSYGEITANRELVDQWLEERLRLEVVQWGVELREGGFTTLNPGHTYNEEIQLRSGAIAKRDATITEAEGEKQKRILEGEGTANALQLQFEAEAKGKKAIRDALGVSGEAVLASELGEKIAENGNAVIADGLGGLGAMFGAGTEAFKKTQRKRKT
ncbi:MAG: hypothetical protein RLZZ76_182 [Candidatus Parcubacteria bacterium]|jgi:hypothetical protein